MSLNGEIRSKKLNIVEILVIRTVSYANHRSMVQLPHMYDVIKIPEVKYKTFCSFLCYYFFFALLLTVLVPIIQTEILRNE